MNYTDILTGLRKIIRSVNLESKRIEKQFGISIPQLLCLNFLHSQAGFQASQKEIKDFLSLNASTVTGIINRLEKSYGDRFRSFIDENGKITNRENDEKFYQYLDEQTDKTVADLEKDYKD